MHCESNKKKEYCSDGLCASIIHLNVIKTQVFSLVINLGSETEGIDATAYSRQHVRVSDEEVGLPCKACMYGCCVLMLCAYCYLLSVGEADPEKCLPALSLQAGRPGERLFR